MNDCAYLSKGDIAAASCRVADGKIFVWFSGHYILSLGFPEAWFLSFQTSQLKETWPKCQSPFTWNGLRRSRMRTAIQLIRPPSCSCVGGRRANPHFDRRMYLSAVSPKQLCPRCYSGNPTCAVKRLSHY